MPAKPERVVPMTTAAGVRLVKVIPVSIRPAIARAVKPARLAPVSTMTPSARNARSARVERVSRIPRPARNVVTMTTVQVARAAKAKPASTTRTIAPRANSMGRPIALSVFRVNVLATMMCASEVAATGIASIGNTREPHMVPVVTHSIATTVAQQLAVHRARFAVLMDPAFQLHPSRETGITIAYPVIAVIMCAAIRYALVQTVVTAIKVSVDTVATDSVARKNALPALRARCTSIVYPTTVAAVYALRIVAG